MSIQMPLGQASRQTVALEPEFQYVGNATAFQDCAARVDQVRPDVVLLDWDLTDIEALVVLRALQSTACPPKVVAFGQYQAACQTALDAGAVAFICREDPMEQLLDILPKVGGLSPRRLDSKETDDEYAGEYATG
jgi:DNA-binding NarL/FixJ family response regulator